MAVTWKERAARTRPRRVVGSGLYAGYLSIASAVSVTLLLVAGYVANGYLIDWASVSVVVVLCAMAGWGVVEVLHGIGDHRSARAARAARSARAAEPEGPGVSRRRRGAGRPARRSGRPGRRLRPAGR